MFYFFYKFIYNIISIIIVYNITRSAFEMRSKITGGALRIIRMKFFVRHRSICFDKHILLKSRLQYSHINFFIETFLYVPYMLPFLYE